ncbi:MAG: 4-hydroxythreonine-4-phosphate dehydrogenase [Piscirickettsiaceae bacterium]|nr:MAG: 4-hydroxythreonine-4-phosphate dehydrogenase [Piscirickettsiaceae bacterium]
MSVKPKIATMIGDPAGIGPEVVAKAWATGELHDYCVPVLVGSAAVMQRAVKDCGLSLDVVKVNSVDESHNDPAIIDIIDSGKFDVDSFTMAQDNASCGQISADWLDEMDKMALAGDVDGTVMAPISSVSMKMAGTLDKVINMEPGHSYLFLISGPLRVMHLTDHLPLRTVCDLIKRDLVTGAIKQLNQSLKEWGIAEPRIAVAGLNPHASGVEEEQEITPGVEDAQALGINVVGPIAPDSVFRHCIDDHYDVVLAMFHDQGHIAIKTWGFSGNCALIMGPPYLHMSVAHGTAYDLAGTGQADHSMILEAIKLTGNLAAGHGFFKQ